MAHPTERGFTLIEVLVASGLMVVVLMAAFQAVRHLAIASRNLAQRHGTYAAVEQLVNRWETESRTAEAITIPSFGCPEVEFFARDGAANAPAMHFWSYRFDAAAGTVTRYASNTGPIAPCAAGATGNVVASNVTQFTPAVVLASRLDGAAGRTDSPFVVAGGPTDASVPLGIFEADGVSRVAGGNRIVEIALETDAASRVVDLLPGVQPSGYTLTLQYSCDGNARCDPHAPHDGARVNQCAGTYVLQTPGGQAYPTHYALVKPSDPPPKPQSPPGTPPTEAFYWPDRWAIAGSFDFHYTGADTRDRFDGFGIEVPGDPNAAASGYYPAHVTPRGDGRQDADELIFNYSGFPPAAVADNAACDAMTSPVPVYRNG